MGTTAHHEQHVLPPRTAYRISETATRIGVHPDTVRNWIRSGELHSVKIGRTVLVPAYELDRLAGDAA